MHKSQINWILQHLWDSYFIIANIVIDFELQLLLNGFISIQLFAMSMK